MKCVYRLIYIPTAKGSKYKAHIIGAHKQNGHQRSADIEVLAATNDEAFRALERAILPEDPRPLKGRSLVTTKNIVRTPAMRAPDLNEEKMQRAIAAYLQANGWNVMVIGGSYRVRQRELIATKDLRSRLGIRNNRFTFEIEFTGAKREPELKP